MHVAIAGNIGAGKTTLTKLLAKHFNWEAQYEDVLENPYLEDFYNKMERWSRGGGRGARWPGRTDSRTISD